jgi:hypothetical protein
VGGWERARAHSHRKRGEDILLGFSALQASADGVGEMGRAVAGRAVLIAGNGADALLDSDIKGEEMWGRRCSAVFRRYPCSRAARAPRLF